jgi:hypothetical protein
MGPLLGMSLHHRQKLGISSLVRYLSNITGFLTQKILFVLGKAGRRLFAAQLNQKIPATFVQMVPLLLITTTHLQKSGSLFLVKKTLTLSSS